MTISRGEESLGLMNPGQLEIPVSEKISHHWLSACPLPLLSRPKAEGHRLTEGKKKSQQHFGCKWFRMCLLLLLTPALCQEGYLVPRKCAITFHGEMGRGQAGAPQSIAQQQLGTKSSIPVRQNEGQREAVWATLRIQGQLRAFTCQGGLWSLPGRQVG